MAHSDVEDGPSRSTVGWSLAVGAVVGGGIILGVVSSWAGLAEESASVLRALWVIPGLVGLHLGQLFLAGTAWRCLFAGLGSDVGTFYRLRIIREGIDSLLPVAQVSGEIVGARLLSQHGIALSRAGASVIVDVTIEFLTQVAFLLAGLCTLAWLSHGGAGWGAWLGAALAGVGATAALLLAQRFGLLRAVEALMRGIARRWPVLAGASLDGLHAAALGFYRRPTAMAQCIVLHLLAWALGSVETWVVLNALGVPATPLQVFTVESLGMAARSAGFAIPAALGAQEGGFVLAAASVGLPVGPAFALSLVKRVREILVGSIGLVLWRLVVRRPAMP